MRGSRAVNWRRQPALIRKKYKNEYLSASFSDAISIYLLSLFIDVDYYDLRERDYPLLAPAQMAERLKKVAELFPATPGFEFTIYYKRRTSKDQATDLRGSWVD